MTINPDVDDGVRAMRCFTRRSAAVPAEPVALSQAKPAAAIARRLVNKRQRANLLKLAAYLESLPRSYKHFDMNDYAEHLGDCDLEMDPLIYAAENPTAFLANCGTVACALGHGPAAGIKMSSDELSKNGWAWAAYSARVFGVEQFSSEFNFLFASKWKNVDNHHYGAAARIRYFLETGRGDRLASKSSYAPYRKGSRSAKRREIDAVPA